MSNLTALEALQKVWSRVHNPNSSCPDIELGRLYNVMVETLIQDCPLENNTEEWVKTFIILNGDKGCSESFLSEEYAERKKPRVYVEDWESHDFEKEEAEYNKYVAEALVVVESLLARKILSKDSEGIIRVMVV